MAFWGVEVKPGKPFTLKPSQATEIRRLHLSQATLGLGNATIRSIVQCNVGSKSPLFLCILSPEKVESCQLNLEFEEADEVIFSVIGPRSVHLTGYFLGRSSSIRGNDDESESFGEDIVDTDVDIASSNDDYDYNDSFIDDDPSSGRGLQVSSSDDEVSIKEMLVKTKAKKRNGRGERLRKYQVSDSESDNETSTRADDSSNEDFLDNPLPSTRTTRSEARSSTLENGESNSKCNKTSETRSSTLENGESNSKCNKRSETRSSTMENGESNNKVVDEREDKPLGDVELSSDQKDYKIPVKIKRKKEKRKISVIVRSDEGEKSRKNMPEDLQNAKTAIDKEVKSSTDVLPSQQNGEATLLKKKRKRDQKEETAEVQKNLSECSENKKQAVDNRNIESQIDTKKLVEPEDSSNGVIIEELKKGNLEGKLAVRGKKISILYTGKLKDSGKLIDSNLGEAPLRFRLGGGKVIKGLNIGVEGMRVGDKRRLIIPPSFGYVEGLKEDVPKNAWLVYEVEAVKIR